MRRGRAMRRTREGAVRALVHVRANGRVQGLLVAIVEVLPSEASAGGGKGLGRQRTSWKAPLQNCICCFNQISF